MCVDEAEYFVSIIKLWWPLPNNYLQSSDFAFAEVVHTHFVVKRPADANASRSVSHKLLKYGSFCIQKLKWQSWIPHSCLPLLSTSHKQLYSFLFYIIFVFSYKQPSIQQLVRYSVLYTFMYTQYIITVLTIDRPSITEFSWDSNTKDRDFEIRWIDQNET